jgi:iron complex outermembrane receptor protein
MFPMRALPFAALSSVSFAALTFGLASPAAAQQQAAPSPEEAQQCAALATEQERQLCLQGQRTEATPEEAGDIATQDPAEVAADKANSETIVVTGSRIRRSAFTSPDPITVIDPELELKGGQNSTAEIIQNSPAAAGSFQITELLSAGSFVTNGGVGAQTVSLRGLGAERTLVLLNGRRAGPAGTRGSIGSFDLNVIPSAILQNVEILKTGASSIYGSDAIAGVVNLITKKSTDGLQLRLTGTAPFQSGGENYGASAVWGKDFGRGHIIGGVDYYRRNNLQRGQRDYLLCSEEYVFDRNGSRLEVNDPRTGQPRCNTTQTSYLSLSSAFTYNGTAGVTFSTLQFNDAGDRLDEFLSPFTNSAALTIPTGYFALPTACTVAAAGVPANTTLCRNALGLVNQRDPRLAKSDVQPSLDRYTAYLQGGFEITDSIEIVGEALYNKRKTATNSFRQLFPQSQFAGAYPAANSSLAPAALCTPLRRVIKLNCNPAGTGDPFNQGFTGNILITPVVPIDTFVGTDVDYYRGVIGLNSDLGGLFGGGFLNGWRFDSYYQYSRNDGKYTNSRVFQDSVDLIEYRTQGCQPGQVTRVRGAPCVDIDFTDPRVLNGDFTPAERAFLFADETGTTKYTQQTVEASVSGDLFRMPAGPVGVAFGAQFRRDEIDDRPGSIAQAVNPSYNPAITPGSAQCNPAINPLQVCDQLISNVWGQSVSGRTAGFTRSKEAFAEIEVPLVHNTPFIQSLTLSGAARVVSGYAERNDGASDKDSGNWTYKVGANWTVNDWLRFRGSVGTSFRAPALFEQFLANQTGFQGQAAIDPCIRYGENLTPAEYGRVAQRCAALGLDPLYNAAGSSSAVVTSGGGVGVLDPETSKAKSFSVVLTPRTALWKGMRFSVAVDYFDIRVKNQLTTLGAANIVFGCLNSNTYPDDPLCSLVTRNTDPASPNFGNILSVRNPYVNINSQKNRGVDLTLRVTQDLGRYGRLSFLGEQTWQLEDFFVLFAGQESNSEGTVGEPKFVGDYKLTYDNGPWSVFYGVNVTSRVSDEQFLRNARSGQLCFASPIRGGDICPVYSYPATFYHSASVTRSIAEGRFRMTLGVSNLFDTKPPRPSGSFGPTSVTGQIPTFGTQYDLLGRRAFISVNAKI